MKLWSGGTVKRSDIPTYWTEYYFSALSIYNRFKRFGMPFTGGWAEQPEYLVRIMEVFDALVEQHEQLSIKKAKNGTG